MHILVICFKAFLNLWIFVRFDSFDEAAFPSARIVRDIIEVFVTKSSWSYNSEATISSSMPTRNLMFCSDTFSFPLSLVNRLAIIDKAKFIKLPFEGFVVINSRWKEKFTSIKDWEPNIRQHLYLDSLSALGVLGETLSASRRSVSQDKALHKAL